MLSLSRYFGGLETRFAGVDNDEDRAFSISSAFERCVLPVCTRLVSTYDATAKPWS